MTQGITLIEQALLETVRSLPLERQRQVLDFAEFLALKANKSHEADIQPAMYPSKLNQQWAGGLRDYREQYTSVELQKETLKNWDGSDS